MSKAIGMVEITTVSTGFLTRKSRTTLWTKECFLNRHTNLLVHMPYCFHFNTKRLDSRTP